MLKIGICDDEKVFCNIAKEACEKVVNKYHIQCEFKLYNAGNAILNDNYQADILVLDVEMPGLNGFEIAEQYLKKHPNSYVIFLTSHMEQMREAFKVRAYRYLLKPVNMEELEEALLRVNRDIENSRLIILNNGQKENIIKKRDLLYIESLGDGCAIHTMDTYYTSGKTLKYYESLLNKVDFYKISRNCIVAFEHIKRIDKGRVYLDNGVEFEVSRRQKKECKEAFFNYIRLRTYEG